MTPISRVGHQRYENDPTGSSGNGGNNNDAWVCRHGAPTVPSTTLQAGGSTTLSWHFGAKHVGDCDVYLSYDFNRPRSTMRWFKIANFFDCRSQSNQEPQRINLPSWLPNGQAVLRWGWYALHQVQSIEFYSQCADVRITNSRVSSLPSNVVTYPLINPPIFPLASQNGEYPNRFGNAASNSWMVGPPCAGDLADSRTNQCYRTAPGTPGHIDVGQSASPPSTPTSTTSSPTTTTTRTETTTSSQTSSGNWCSMGVTNTNQDTTVCCPASCGTCGGDGCGGRPGGAENCCTGHIVRSNSFCTSDGDTSCIIPGGNDDNNEPDTPTQNDSDCPDTCSTCQSGGIEDSGVMLVNGKCQAFCSQYGFCGTSAIYQDGGTDCTGCANTQTPADTNSGVISNRCGSDWVDANSRCGAPCVFSDSACPSGEKCFAGMTLACPTDFFRTPEDAAPLENGEDDDLLTCENGWETRETAGDIPTNWCEMTCSHDETQMMCDQDVCQCIPSAAFHFWIVLALLLGFLQL